MFGKYEDSEVKQFQSERIEALRSLDIEYFKPFYGKWVAKGMYPSMLDDTLLEVEMYRQAARCDRLPTSRKEEARDWLRYKGYRESDI